MGFKKVLSTDILKKLSYIRLREFPTVILFLMPQGNQCFLAPQILTFIAIHKSQLNKIIQL